MSARLIPLSELGAALIDRWRELGHTALEANAFLGPDVVLPAARRLGAGAGIALAVVEHGRQLRFALPVVRTRTYRRLPLPTVATWRHDYCYLGTPLVAPDAPADTWRAALGALDAVAPVTALGLLGLDGPVAAALRAALGPGARRAVTLGRRERPVVRRRPEPTYLGDLSASRRKNLRRNAALLAAELGEVRLVEHLADGRDLDAAVDGFLAMEAAGWKGREGTAIACRPGHAEFFRETCHRLAAQGALWLTSLEAGGRPVAWDCLMLAGDTLFAFKTTYDEDLRRFSPGVQVLSTLLTRFHADERFAVIDSCTGLSETITHELFPDRRPLGELVLMPAGAVGQAAAWATPRAAAVYRRLKDRRALVNSAQ
ncbi:GNAT family N-acetyltransferase [Spirilliplanes yamanashiensis]|uniref:BioF2-like acetyltransferase domain-containing protein n=1 Tax=Spirilliplanes yamanashiensis TaxID=42233 RepID=A0A8J4DLB9_9ACTN|nr:GNAT family N-acetyltransferase [Spirilliplanes yamanashiensis]MDP9818095.1 CelD/BcsL family acetyltransferase involved in cellulose biosynthesis [Spirilliplanes yamanashiensis]GIJ04905.1 hypothetical protein Sya03_42570 [Spirilliplanes yamanashiensis]